MSWCSDTPEDEAISLFAGLLANPDVRLSLYRDRTLSDPPQNPCPGWSHLLDPPKTPGGTVRGRLICTLFRKTRSGVVSFVPCSEKHCPGWSHLFTNGDRDRRPGPVPVVSPVQISQIGPVHV